MKLAHEIMNKVFDIIEWPYPHRNKLKFKSRNIRTVTYGTETAAFVGYGTTYPEFKTKIKTWKPENCALCKVYLQWIGHQQVS